jgi:hypothetical protein
VRWQEESKTQMEAQWGVEERETGEKRKKKKEERKGEKM